ncbi:MAG TPA: hypothetical protein VHP14_10310, partial [Anaerolineales bacterium]|nr:hypothetical protein [Anaerolineales bacterium]
MRKTLFHLLGFLTVAALVLSACNLPSATSEATVQPSATATVPTVTQTAAPTDTITVTATETMTPEPSATATPQPPMADVLRESNCRVHAGISIFYFYRLRHAGTLKIFFGANHNDR